MQRKGHVSIPKIDEQIEGTYSLEKAEEGKKSEYKGNPLSKGCSLSGDRRKGDKSGHRKKATKQGALTAWRPQSMG